MSATKIAYRYGKSLLSLAQDQGILDRVLQDVILLQESFNVKELRNLVNSPIVKADKKKSIFRSIFVGKVSELMSKYFDIIIAKGREPFLPQIAESFIEQYNNLQNTTTVKLTTAQGIQDEMLGAIKKEIESSTVSNDKVIIEVEVDPSLIGGFVLDIDDMQYDGSVKKKLKDLKQEFTK